MLAVVIAFATVRSQSQMNSKVYTIANPLHNTTAAMKFRGNHFEVSTTAISFCRAMMEGTQSNQEYYNICLDCVYMRTVDTFFLARVSWRLAGPMT